MGAGCCCCKPSRKIQREIKLGCFGIDGSGKSTVLRILKGEDPRGVVPTNGFSHMEMDYDSDFFITVYELGGAETIRDIWANYYAEIHAVLYIVNLCDASRVDETYRVIGETLRHPALSGKPVLVVINNMDNSEMDEIEFSNTADLHTLGNAQNLKMFMAHIRGYTGSLNNAKPKPVFQRAKTDRHFRYLLTHFCAFIDKVIENYAILSEGVRAAEQQLQIRKQTARDERAILHMQKEHELRAADIAGLDGYPTRSSQANGHVNPLPVADDEEGEVEDLASLPGPSYDLPSPHSQLSSDVFEPPTEREAPVASATGTGRITRRMSKNKINPIDTGQAETNHVDDKLFTITRGPGLQPLPPGQVINGGITRQLSRMERIQQGLQVRKQRQQDIQLQQLSL